MRERLAAVCLVSVVLGAPAVGQVIDFRVEFDGTINGDPIRASGSGAMERQGTGENFASVAFDAVPDNFQPLAFDALLTNVCGNSFRAEGGSDNLWDLGGGSYQIERTFQWIGFPGSVVTSTAEVTFDENTQTMHSSMTFSGTYRGPTDLEAIESYGVLWLPGSTAGEVFEAGTALVRRSTGDLLIVQFATRYYGLRDSLSGSQIGIGAFDTTYDGRTMTVGWDGYFEVPAPGVLSLAGAGLLVGSRRRR